MAGTDAINKLVEEKAEEIKHQSETPEEKAAREAAAAETDEQKAAREAAAGAETAEQKAEREKKEKEASVETPAQKAEREAKEKSSQEEPSWKKAGFESEQEMLDFVSEKKKPAETEEEKKKREEREKVGVIAYAVEEGIMTTAQISELDALNKKEDFDLVYEGFVSDQRDEVAEDLEKELSRKPTEAEIFEELQERFDKEYPVESEKEKVKQRAEARIKQEAERIREPLKSSFEKAKTRFSEEQAIKVVYPKYNKEVSGLIDSAIPKKVDYFSDKVGEEDVKCEVELTDDDQKFVRDKLIDKILKDEKTFSLFQKGDTAKIKEIIAEATEALVEKRVSLAGRKKIAEVYESRGLKKGSTTGAESSFATKQAQGNDSGKKDKVSAEQEAIAATRKKS